ncbi:Gfo/Idh/MocA family protein [Sulfoacidibacillus thermotolerans]|uniref:Oxidoreductase n=1 Tax=Sulfoacidibacillus thermotolerans TaxID=1765684 RepID=A0A2U3DCV0_SULT2|nr:Gfo/Idh/MocA family oxidoreductase [Sulfoacidibacillus thermotolerans]PWI59092.1 hypothetical protein BM613_00275 [Sulfoacidibacillus thermotolerans]
MLNWGILGTAHIAETQLIPALHAASNARVVGVASRNRDKAQEYAKRNRILHSYDSYEQLLADPDIDAVYIPLPNGMHAYWTLQAARAGKHVLCEKPAALNAAEMREMATVCQENGVVFMEAFMYPFHPQWDRIEQLLAENRIGDLKIVNASFSFTLKNTADIRWDPLMGGGALYDVGCYCVHVARNVAKGEPVTQVQAAAQFRADGMVDESLVGNLRFANGMLAHFDCSFAAVERQFVEIVGSKGSVQVLFPFRPDKGTPTLLIRDESGETRETLSSEVNMYTRQVEHFAECVWLKQTPRITLHDSIQNLEIIDALYKAAGRKNKI